MLAIRIVATVLGCTIVNAVAADARADIERGQAALTAGDALAGQGQFEAAIERWKDAEKAFTEARDAAGEIHALLRQADACHAVGQQRLAMQRLAAAERVLKAHPNQRLEASVKAARGALSTFGREADEAEPLLREALKLARAERDPALIAPILNDLGIVLAAREKTDEALAASTEAARLARDGGNLLLAGKALRNAAEAALAGRRFAVAQDFARQAAKAAAALPDSQGKAFLLMGVGQAIQRMFLDAPDHDNSLRGEALRLHRAAAACAEKIGDERSLAYALGYQGALYEFEKRPAEALALTRKAVFAAQHVQAVDALYRWQWQSGRLLAQMKERDPAIEAYRRAIATLQTVRTDVATRQGNRNARSSFRSAVGSIYLELADLLLQRADAEKDAEAAQALLREARDTAELLKAAELEDYFQDDCVNLLKAKRKKIESFSPTAAVIYIIALPLRTELLVSLPSGKLERFKVDVSGELLSETARIFRLNLEDRSTDSYLVQAQQLYTWLIQPLEPLMTAGRFDTMVFVPDGTLRTIPMAALHDGAKFLVEKYAIAVTPGLELMEAAPASRARPQIMISGISESVEGFAPLANVPAELAEISRLYGRKDALMNRDFRHDSVSEKLTGGAFTIVHIASHGHFDEDVRKSFVLTFDKRLTLDDLERSIRPAQLRDRPLELLTLSACQTAAGDDRAALGLAGVAVKAGARSAFATLWFVNDAASTEIMGDFYSELTTHPEQSKAHALQAAQRKLLVQPRYSHPCYWAPYLIIGNWL